MTAPTAPTAPTPDAAAVLATAARLRTAVLGELRKVIVGQEETLDLLLTALVTGGHVLLEGVPGVAKTLMVRALARAVDARFARVQFTPDLMPADVLGTSIFDLRTQAFALAKGPIFTDLLLADEINRAPAKTQSALLEAMQERAVSLEGKLHELGAMFTVFATQNPVESEGTYPLPEAQLDRFLFKLQVGYPTEAEEDALLLAVHRGLDAADLASTGVRPVVGAEPLLQVRRGLLSLTVEPAVLAYVRRVVAATRASPLVRLGAGPRGSIHLLLSAKTRAALQGRPFVTPDDVRALARPVLQHRLLLSPEAELDGVTPAEVLDEVLANVEVPR